MKRVIHVNRHHIAANKKGADKPVITCKTYKDTQYGNDVAIKDAAGNVVARVTYRPEKPLSCGATVWIETHCDVEVT